MHVIRQYTSLLVRHTSFGVMVGWFMVMGLGNLLAQTENNLLFHLIDGEQGVKYSETYHFFRDASGLLWISTQEGLAYFDGDQVHYYQHDPTDSLSIPENQLTSPCFEDQQGNLWFTTTNYLVYYQRAQGQFTHFQIPAPGGKDYYAFYLDEAGELWLRIGVGEKGALWQFRPQDGVFKQAAPLPGRQAIVLEKDTGEPSYVVTYDLPSRPGVVVLNLQEGTNKYIEFQIEADGVQRYYPSPVTSCWADQNGGFWAGVYNGLVYWHPTQDHFYIHTDREETIDEELDEILGVVPYDDQHLLLATTSGMVEFDIQRLRFSKQYRPHRRLSHSIPFTSLSQIYRDPLDRIWVVGRADELAYSHLKQTKFSYVPELLGQEVLSLAVDADYQVWCGTNDNGVYTFTNRDTLTHHVHYLNNLALPLDSFSMPPVYNFLARDSHWWANSDNNFLHWNPVTDTFDFIQQYFLPFDGNFSESISQCLTLADGRQIAVKYDDVLELQLSEEKVSTTPWYDLEYLQLGEISLVWQDPIGRFYINNTAGDLLIFEEQNEQLVEQLRHQEMGVCNAFLYDAQREVIWVATNKGLGQISSETLSYQLFNWERDSIPNEMYTNVIVDQSGTLWLPGNRGLMSYLPEQRTSHLFGEADGLLANSFTRNSSLYLPASNEIWLGSNRGLNIFDPSQINLSDDQPAVFLSKLLVNDNPLEKGGQNSNEITTLNLPFADNTLSFEFTALDYSAPDANEFSYQLEGYEAEPIYAGTNNFVRYPNLPAGKYQFKVWTTNADKIWNEVPKVLDIIVYPPFYQTWWFRLLSLLAITAIIYAIFRYRLEQALKVERLRVKISSDLHDDVGGMLSGLAMQSELLEMTATEDTKPKLARLAEISRSAMSRMRDTVWAIDARKDHLKNLIDRMREHAEETLEARHIQYSINTTNLNLEQKLATDVRQNLYLIYKEAITNVAKHSNGDTVNITLAENKDGFTFTIHDNGQVKTKDYTTTGLGQSNMRMRAEAIGARFIVDVSNGFKIEVRRDRLA